MAGVGAPAFSLSTVGVAFGDLWALEGVDLDIRSGEKVALIGPSGAGKTTLLSLLNGNRLPSQGNVRIFGHDPGALDGHGLRKLQRRIGAIHQQFDLVGALKVIHNVNAGHLGRWSLAQAVWSLLFPREVQAAEEALERVGIKEKLFERTDRLSGGEQQRVALARALIQDPEVILADEPIASLDPGRSKAVMDLLSELASELGKTLVVSLHEYHYGLSHFERVVGLRSGRVFFDERADAVADDMVAELYRLERRPGE